MERGSNGVGSVSSKRLFLRVPANPKISANKVDDTIPWVLLYVSSVFMLFKQYVNVVQLVEASKLLVQGDVEMRKKAQLTESKRNT
ncbi:CDP-diacylglycerol-inositol 3-phosphatidyltransferase [Aspergillus sclerotialis]|uniref:CDP-diacylglycerol-inositol 3-phosphatidyltransferase n=1 Tax=Aspergillus sclerotialis TaxID=2070753 RepID=A0A3A2ZJ05_9EURO|nr:CDP-diacylglycerol-inositol 3-phosphatidyltransferase [Aspergillus sclerotialis]